MTQAMCMSAIAPNVKRLVAQKEFEESLIFLGHLSLGGDRTYREEYDTSMACLSWENAAQDIEEYFQGI